MEIETVLALSRKICFVLRDELFFSLFCEIFSRDKAAFYGYGVI